MQKTNKSYTKRIRKTKNGKMLTRPKSQNHFNAKQSGVKKMKKRKLITLSFAKKVKDRFLSKI